MSVPFVNAAFIPSDVSPRTSLSLLPSTGQHLRRRSSQSQPATNLLGASTERLYYNARTGEIELPSEKQPLWSVQRKTEKQDDIGGLPPWSHANPAFGAWYDSRKAQRRRSWLPKPWLTVLAMAALVLVVLGILSICIDGARSPLKTTFTTRLKVCEPYSSFGTLEVDDSDPDANRWMPFDPTCQPPKLMSALREEQTKRDLSFLRGKTALVIGDTVSREHVENFCRLVGEEPEIVRPSHKYSIFDSLRARSTERPTSKARLDYRDLADRSKVKANRDASSPRICLVRKYDFMIVSVLHYGLDQEDFWSDAGMPQYSSPGMFEQRLIEIVEPLMKNIRADRPTAPDLVEVTSGIWDLARWAEQDLDAQQSTEGPLSQDRVTWWRFRVGQVLDKVGKAFPKAGTLLWRTTYYPQDQVAEYAYFQDKIARRESNMTLSHEPPHFAHNRINQLDQAARSLILPRHTPTGRVEAPHSEFRINEWGQILKGHVPHQRDRLHGDPLPGGYVWSDTILYELQRAASLAKQR